MRAIPLLVNVVAALILLGQSAAAELLVAPLRQVVTVKDPVARYRISNPSGRMLEARIGWVDLAATPAGYAPAEPAIRSNISAAPYLTVSPARLRLEPGGHAEVVVQLKKGVTPPPGERRSHLLIETTPARTPLRRAGEGLEVDVGLGVSTPVILRGGYVAPTVSFGASELVRDENGLLVLETTLISNGRYSAYGEIEAVLGQGENKARLARVANVAVYPDAGARKLTIPLGMETLPMGAMRLTFADADRPSRVVASKTFEIGPPPAPLVSADQ